MTREEYEYNVELPKYEELEFSPINVARLKTWNKYYYGDDQCIPKNLVLKIEDIPNGKQVWVKDFYIKKKELNSDRYERFINKLKGL